MAKKRTPVEMLELASRMLAKFTSVRDKYLQKAEYHKDRHDVDRAGKAARLAAKNQNLVYKWERAERSARARVENLENMRRRAPAPAPSEPDSPTEGQKRAMERDSKAERLKVAQQGKRLSAAAVRYDPRTASGQRQYDLLNMGATMRASVNHFNAVIKWPADRTAVRLLAWQAFDSHYHAASAGSMPLPKFEPGVDSSATPNVAEAKLWALNADYHLRCYLGPQLHQLLVEVVYGTHHLRDLPGLSDMDTRSRTLMLLQALDKAAKYWRLDEVRKVRTRVSHVALDMSSTD